MTCRIVQALGASLVVAIAAVPSRTVVVSCFVDPSLTSSFG